MNSILAFEGPDKVGKSTVIRHLNRLTDYRYFCIDRFVASGWVYDNLTGRRDRTEELAASERELGKLACTKVINVFLTCDREVLAERLRREETEADARLRTMDQMIELYEQYKEVTELPYIQVDTTHVPVDDTVHEILGKLHEFGV